MTTDFAEALVEELQKDELLDKSATKETKKSETAKEILVNSAVEETAVSEKEDVRKNDLTASEEASEPTPEKNKSTLFQQTISKEITALQTVEQILFGVEREQLKTASSPFDTLKLNKTLHDHQKLEPENLQVVALESVILQEIEKWKEHLTERDKKVSLKDLRLYCETTKPALSAKAVITLAQFYRKNCHDEVSYRKFELLFTRVFAAEEENEKRSLVCETDDVTKHLGEIFTKWEVGKFETDLVQLAKIEEIAKELPKHESFSSFLVDEFFARYQSLKQEVGENIFEPRMLTAVIHYNIEFGNKFVALIAKEKTLNTESSFEEKKSFINCYESQVSEAIGKTLVVDNIQKEKLQPVKPKANIPIPTINESKKKKKVASFANSGFQINKWLLAACFSTLLAFGTFYAYVEFGMTESKASPQVKSLSVKELPGGENLKVAKVHQQKMSAVVSSDWSVLTLENKKKILSDILAQGEQKGYNAVDFLDAEGKKVGYATKEKVEVYF